MRTLPIEVERVVALVNLVERTGPAMTAVLEAHGETHVRLTSADVVDLAAVCETLHAIFGERDADRAAASLNGLLATHAGPPRLVRHEGWTWHLHVDRSDDAPWADWLASSGALALATRLAASDGVPWGVCAADGCANVFVDDGRGGGRHWCSTTCATRERVRRHRELSRRPPARRTRGGASATG